MRFWRKKEKTIPDRPPVTKAEVLHGLNSRSAYFERHTENQELFRPEWEVSTRINSILRERNTLIRADVDEILALFNDIDKVEHYDGSGWHDYQIQLACFLRLHGFGTTFENRKLQLE